MTITDLLQKIRSTDKRDALARKIINGYCCTPKGAPVGEHEGSWCACEVSDAIHEIYDARTKDVELLVALLIEAIDQRNLVYETYRQDNNLLRKNEDLIERDDKELAELAERFK